MTQFPVPVLLAVSCTRQGVRLESDFLQKLLHCQFVEVEDYTNWINSHDGGFLLRQNRLVMKACKGKPAQCLGSQSLQELCLKSDQQVGCRQHFEEDLMDS